MLPPIFPDRIRAFLGADPFVPFTVYLTDHHSIHIGDPATAWLEEDGRALTVETLILKDTYLQTVDTAAIIRVLVKAETPAPEFPVTEETFAFEPPEPVAPEKTRLLFICTRNGARSQMAEAWLNGLGGESFEAASAGFESGELHPLAIEAMREVGIDISGQKTKSIFELYRAGAMFACTICVCDESAEKTPIFPGPTERLHWSIPDPLAGGDGSDAAML
ncbi:MAG: arsenate reductase ArsC, partial [Chthoniobacteraceae bacterium]